MIFQIRKVENGYIVRDGYGTESIYFNISEVFSELLLRFEGKSEHSKGDFYGEVKIITKKGEKSC